ncbi:MAG: phage major capsid protein [Acidobacteria bacterium]|jgi:HK97 family phage major capsid protein|nr:phage major capsid protein [Acidobacteriota bacterium]
MPSIKEFTEALDPLCQDIKEARAETKKLAEWIADVDARSKAGIGRGDSWGYLDLIPAEQRQTIDVIERRGDAVPVRKALLLSWLKAAARCQIPAFAGKAPEYREQIDKIWQHFNNKAYLNETATPGSYTVPTMLATDIIRMIEDASVVRRLAAKQPLSSRTTNAVSVATNVTCHVVAEMGGAITQGEPTFAQKTLTAKDFVAYGQASVDVLQDEAVGLLDFFLQSAAQEIGKKEDAACLQGTAGDPAWAGIYAQTTTSSYTVDKTLYVEATSVTNTPTTPTLAKLSSAIYGPLHAASRQGAAWVMHPLTFADLQVQTSSSLPLYNSYITGNTMQATASGPAAWLLNYPVYLTDQVFNSTEGASIYFGAWNPGIVIGDRTGIDFAVSEHEKFQYGLVSMRVIKRTAGLVALPHAFSILRKCKAAVS